MPDLDIGRLVGYVELDDSGVAEGAQAVKDRVGELGKSGATLAKAAGAGMAVAIGAGLMAAIDVQGANAKLTAQLDLNAAESERLGGVAGRLYADAYGENIGEVNDALRSVIQNIGELDDAELEDVTGKVQSLATAFDQDLGGVTRAVGTMLRTGLAKDADEALDVLASGFQNGVNVADDLLEVFAEYGTQARKLGLDGAQFTAILSQGLKGGARDADIVADALKEISIRAVDGSELTAGSFAALGLSGRDMADAFAAGGDTAAAALDLTLDRLRAIPDPVARSAAAVGLFGTQAEDLGEALYAIDPSKAVGGLKGLEGAAGRVDAALGGTLMGSLTRLGRQLYTLASDALGPVIPVLTGVGDVALEVVVPPLRLIGDVIGAITGLFGELPGPIQSGIVVLGALVLLRGPVEGLGASFAKLTADAVAWGTYGVATAIGGMGSLSASAIAAETSVSGLAKRGIGGLSAMLGGPLGLGIAAVSIGLPLLSSLFGDNSDKADEAARANSTLATALRDSAGAIDDNVRASAAKELEDKGALATAEKYGLSLDRVTDAALGNKDAFEEVTGKLQALADAKRQAYIDDGGVINEEERLELLDAKAALEDLAPTVAQTAEEQRRLAEASDTATDGEAGLEGQLAATNKEGETQKSVLEQLTDLFDEITGGAQSMAAAQLDVADGLAKLAEEAKSSGTSLDDNTQKGRDNQRAILDQIEAIEGLASATLESTGSSALAREAYDRETGALRDKLVALGYNKDEIDELLARYANIPDEAWTSIEQPGMTKAQEAADLLRDKILGVPDGKTIHTEALTGTTITTLEALGYKVDHLPDGTINVTAATAQAEKDLAYLARVREVQLQIKASPVAGQRGLHVSGGWMLEADGGIVEHYAGGGWHDAARAQGLTPVTAGRAQVAGPDTWRVFGDRADVDEFYLPDDDAPATLAYGAEWARRRGLGLVPIGLYGDGGTNPASSASAAGLAAARGALALAIHIDGNVYGDAHLRRAIADAGDELLERLDNALSDAGVHP